MPRGFVRSVSKHARVFFSALLPLQVSGQDLTSLSPFQVATLIAGPDDDTGSAIPQPVSLKACVA